MNILQMGKATIHLFSIIAFLSTLTVLHTAQAATKISGTITAKRAGSVKVEFEPHKTVGPQNGDLVDFKTNIQDIEVNAGQGEVAESNPNFVWVIIARGKPNLKMTGIIQATGIPIKPDQRRDKKIIAEDSPKQVVGQESIGKVVKDQQETFQDSTTGMEFVYVKGGCYPMGDTFGDGFRFSHERPVHEVCVDDFYMGKYEVTQDEWQKIMGNNPSHFNKGSSYPVEQVSWHDTQDFIHRLISRSGKNYILPTEAQWEYAARSGGKNEKYAGSNSIDSVGWHKGNSSKSTHPVGQKQPNGLGIYDMSGNVSEWCSDWFDENYYSSSPHNNPPGSSAGSYRILRGGTWYNKPRSARAYNRARLGPEKSSSDHGFRLALPIGR